MVATKIPSVVAERRGAAAESLLLPLTLVELEADVSAAADADELAVVDGSEGQVTFGEAGTSMEAGDEPYGQL